ncbi:MAG: trimeric intracellular cation channel family protein [Thiobacillaceae bacterium]|jgi:uncharacterized membrane protein YeiH|nr:trimeric intracellular cation channel family protein [Thiobacillaceae bacterium]
MTAIDPYALVYWVGMAAVAVNAITAVLETEDKGMDLVGAVVVGLAASLGGGTLRDVLLDRRVFWLTDPAYLICALLSVALTFAVARRARLTAGGFVIPDAVGLALFTVVGTQVALDLQTPWLAASLMGVITGVLGGVLRDVLVNEVPLVMRPGTLYATASWCGALACIAALAVGAGEALAMLLGGLVVFGLRLMAIRYQVRLPTFRARDPGR